jgi:hypothetical protein
MTAPNFLFAPLNRHSDGGLGATGEAFKEAADCLSRRRKKGLSLGHLPTNYLYRHAVELYLKSMIVVIHRRLSIPYGKLPATGTPHIEEASKWLPIYKVHQVSVLYGYLKKVVLAHAAQLKTVCKTDWTAFPTRLDTWIALIAKSDDSSTFLRYTNERDPAGDHAKSSFKKSDIAAILSSLQPGKPKHISYLVLNEKEEVQEAFQSDHKPLPDLSTALKGSADMLSGAHFGFRMELAEGW